MASEFEEGASRARGLGGRGAQRRPAGATGRVRRATAQSPWRSTALGNCVAAELSTAKFPHFTKASLSVLYPFTFDPPAP